jgi:hypothetical protein
VAGGPALVCGALRSFADHLFTTREWALGSRAAATDADWEPVAASLGVDRAHLVRVHQVHGNTVLTARLLVPRPGEGKPDTPPARAGAPVRPDADIIVSNDPSRAVAIQTADCVPLLIADRVIGAVAAAHAGWRGLAAGVPGAAVAALAREFGSRPADLVAAIGPCISSPSYEVGDDVWERFSATGFSDAERARWFDESASERHRQFDGWQAACDQLEAAGVPAGQIHLAALCTATYPDLFCSYRRDGKGAGRMAAAIRPSVVNR